MCYMFLSGSPWISVYLSTNQVIGGSNPSGRAINATKQAVISLAGSCFFVSSSGVPENAQELYSPVLGAPGELYSGWCLLTYLGLVKNAYDDGVIMLKLSPLKRQNNLPKNIGLMEIGCFWTNAT